MENLLPELKSQKSDIDKEWKNLNNMKDDLDGYEKDGNIDKYNSLVPEYNDLVKTYQKDLKKYNNNVILYNQYVKKYNTLITQ